MGISNSREAKTRMIHVRLPEDVHKKLRIRAAEMDVTIQEWVFEAIQCELKHQERQATEK